MNFNFSFILLVLMIICASVNSTLVLDMEENQNPAQVPKSLPRIKEKIKKKLEDITQKFALLNKSSGGRKPCIWIICSKPIINYEKRKEDITKSKLNSELHKSLLINNFWNHENLLLKAKNKN